MDILIQVIISGLIWGSIYALIAMGLALIWGVMDIVNFAHGDFLVIGMYVGYTMYLTTGMDPIWSILVAGTTLFLIGMLTYWLVIRNVEGATPLIQIVATFAVGLFIKNLMQFIFKTDYLMIQPEEQSIFNGNLELFGYSINAAQLAISVIALIAAAVFYVLIHHSETGRSILAVSDNSYAAKLMGVNITRINMITWGIGAAIVGVAGSLLSKFYYIFPTAGVHFGLLSFIIVALGGFRSIPGAFAAGIAVGLVEAIAGYVGNPSFKLAFVFLLYIVVVIIRPKGFLGH